MSVLLFSLFLLVVIWGGRGWWGICVFIYLFLCVILGYYNLKSLCLAIVIISYYDQ